jgi:hypothetical protein
MLPGQKSLLPGVAFLIPVQAQEQEQNEMRTLFSGIYCMIDHGGLLLEPVIAHFQPVHISIPMLIGGGDAAVVNEQMYFDNYEYDFYSPFFVFETGIDIEFNVVRFSRLAVYGAYHYTSNLSVDYYSPGGVKEFSVPVDALRGFSGGVTFKFGKF